MPIPNALSYTLGVKYWYDLYADNFEYFYVKSSESIKYWNLGASSRKCY
jgi:hypothetical protein